MIKCLLIILAALCLHGTAAGQDARGRVPYRIHDNFDTGETCTWEPYPYQQDIGYDPAFGTKKEPAYGNKGSALSRITRPNDATDLSQGFTKRIDLYATADTRLKFVFYMMTDRKPETVDISLGSFDGTLYTHTLKTPAANSWVQVDLPLDAFTKKGKTLPLGEHLQVVVMKAFYPVVNHLPSYNMLMDEFSLNGERPRQFIAQWPSSTWLEQLGQSVLHKHFAAGETVALQVKAEGSSALKAVQANLLAPDGRAVVKNLALYDNGSHGDLTAGDGIWSNNHLYTIKLSDAKGQWTARITGAGDVSFTWDLRFLVPVSSAGARQHPRVFFSEGELAARRAGPEPAAAKKLLENFTGSYKPSTVDINTLEAPSLVPPESVTGGPYARASMGGWYDTQNALAAVVTNEMWQFTLARDAKAGEKAKAALLKLAALSTWNHPWMEANGNHTYFPGAPAAMAAGLGYDLLYQILSEQERALVRNSILENSIKPFYRDMVVLNRMPSSSSNHIGVILSGVGIAAVAIAGDDPLNPDLEPYLSGILAKAKLFMDRTLLPEGSYNEPYTYQEFGYREFVEALFAIERSFGVDYTSTTYLKAFYYYPLYVTQNNRGKYQDLGDTSPTYNFTAQPSQWLVYKMKDPFMYHYVKPAWESGSARGGILPYLWYTEGITPKKRESLPTSKHFVGKGHMVMRSSWSDTGSILIYKAGPNSNHYHLDQGTILLTHNGEELLSDAGHSSNYYANLYYPGYYTQAIGHNVMLVDMNAESQAVGDYSNGIEALKNYPVITRSFAGEISDAVESDLTSVYKGKVSRFTRTLLSTKKGPIFLFDEVKSPELHAYNWLFHAEHTNGKSSITASDNRVLITRNTARLTMDIVSPASVTSRIRSSDRDESFIALSSPKLKNTYFLAVMTPETKPSAGDFGNRSKPVTFDKGGWLGAIQEQAGLTYYGFFRTDSTAVDSAANFTTDASKFTAAVQNGKLVQAYFDGTYFSGFGSLLRCSTPVSAAFRISEGTSALEVKAAQAGQLSFTAGKPKQLVLNGSTVKKFTYNQQQGLVTLAIPAGQSTLAIRN